MKKREKAISTIKEKIRNKREDILEFLAAELPPEETADIMTIKNSRKTVIYSMLGFVAAVFFLVISFFNKDIPRDLCIIVIFITTMTFIYSVLAGSVYYKKYTKGEYKTLKGEVTDISRNVLSYDILSATICDSEGEYHDFEVEPGIKLKKKYRYEICYYEAETKKLVITDAKQLGKADKSNRREKEKGE